MIGFGRYNLLVRIGRGGMGVVWLGRQKVLGRFCAVKLLDPSLAQKPGTDERFLREARTAASLSHPNLVGVFDGDQFDGQHFIAMEYVEGFGLADVIEKCGPVPVTVALHWLRQATVVLDYIHNRGLIHRDVKPATSAGELMAWMQQQRAFADETFAEARRYSDAEWRDQKKELFNKIRNNLERQWSIQDPVALTRIMTNNAALLDEVRAMPPADYQQAKPKLLTRWLYQGRNPRPPGEQPSNGRPTGYRTLADSASPAP